METVGARWKLTPRLHPEYPLPEARVRPDYAVETTGRITGFLELKAPGHDITPDGFTKRDREQWELMRRLPNVLYSNGHTWCLYRGGPRPLRTVRLDGDLYRSGNRMRTRDADGAAFQDLLADFLGWQPARITTVRQLVTSIAPLCQYLREEVLEQLAIERRLPDGPRVPRRAPKPFTALAHHWSTVLFPSTDGQDPDHLFADRYVQTIAFSLLLARIEGVSLTGRHFGDVASELKAGNTVMGRALQLLTETVDTEFARRIDTLVWVVDAVEWKAIKAREPDAHVHLYENFLQEYDRKLRKRSGTYYTPPRLVKEMVRFTDAVLRTRLGCTEGFADDQVTIVDPAMGTGTFLSEIIDQVAEQRALRGEGFRGEAVEQLAGRLVGLERQMAAYAVAQMRITQTLREQDTDTQLGDLRLHLADTLADPYERSTLFTFLPAGDPLVENSRQADWIKREEKVTVMIGNPPDRERAEGEGGWVEKGHEAENIPPLLDAFRLGGRNGTQENKLKNLYVYFWRWATYKVFDQHRPESHRGIVAFISTAGFLSGPGFRGMREYLRRTCTEGWIIELSPERIQPPTRTRLFEGVQQQLAIAVFVRSGVDDKPADIRYAALDGATREEKYTQLEALDPDSEQWRPVRTDGRAPFTPAAEGDWDTYPALGDLLPWAVPGILPKRTWAYSPDADTLRARWRRLASEQDIAEKRALFRETHSRSVDRPVKPLPGSTQRRKSILEADPECPDPVPVAYRPFDREWIIPDNRVLDRCSPDLWESRLREQVYLVEQHSKRFGDGPAVLFTASMPDLDHFDGRGGRVLPLLQKDGSPSVVPGLLPHLRNSYGDLPVTAEDLAAYIAAITAHPGFRARFDDELTTHGIRVPLTGDSVLWREAIAVGRKVIWASTFGERFVDPAEGRPSGADRVWATAHPQVTYQRKVGGEELPERFVHDPDSLELRLGQGAFGPVTTEVREYQVGGQNVLDGWLKRRTGPPSRRAVSELDRIRPDRWQPEWSRELQRVLAVLSHLVALEPSQDELLARVFVSPLISVAELERRSILPVPKTSRRSVPAPVQPDDLPGTEGIEPREPHAVRPLTAQQDGPASAPAARARRSHKPTTHRPHQLKPKDP
ncbi:type ISP restriction/modification enzyme [Streptomyces sp. DSM 42041]|uniref:site-specific DNA-methyltransferase (adenine-specific) n=1 Tax=Streptomyces hazeniae TaxID=3075538 RepID=A0ABU2NNJ8_9ACTN|nr:type ISP restriction/modification enzyme [Streptomyces sp. DSM 42041]MDT0378319.1 type ISP restriction/modification enzyme [Streptomyces sp. DSM 42041]